MTLHPGAPPEDPPRQGLSLIVAVARNGVIGRDGDMPWHLPADLKHFKRSTRGHAIIMGRRTWESIGRPLPGRRNLVVSRTLDPIPEGVERVDSLGEALRRVADDPQPFVVGGARLYAEALPQARWLYRTHVALDVEGDTFFPPVDEDEWSLVQRWEEDDLLFEIHQRIA